MGLIVEINGYKAVGKSTLIKGLRKRYPDAIFREGFRKIQKGVDLSDEETFYDNERKYIKREIEEYEEFIRQDKLVILLRGPEECDFFATRSPMLVYGKDFDSETNLKEELKALRKYKADAILWLDADEKHIMERKNNDFTKPRLNMAEWNKRWNPYLGDYIKALPYTEVLDTNNLNQEEVLNWTVNWINAKLRKINNSIPSRIYIETTNACNARCIMCPHPRMKRKISFMNDELFNIVLDNLKSMDLKNTTVFMHKEGEPFLDNKIVERIKTIRENTNAKEIAINSNGSLLSEEVISGLLNSGLDTLYLSIDGVRKESYEKIRVGLHFEEVMSNLENLFIKMKETHSSLHVILQMLINAENEEEAIDFKNHWSKYPCEIFIKKMHSYLDGGKSSLTTTLSDTQINACTDPFNMIVVYADGSVGNCCWDYENVFNIGNIRDNSIVEIFNGDRIKDIREMHSKFDCKSLVPCNRCMRAFGNDEITGISGGKEIEIK